MTARKALKWQAWVRILTPPLPLPEAQPKAALKVNELGWPGCTSAWPRWKALRACQLPPSTGPGQSAQGPHNGLTWQEEGGPGGNVDLLQMLQRLRVEEANGGAGGEGHPDAAARLHHVRHAHGLILVRLEALLRQREGVSVLGRIC